ncbi:hypothetical protein EI42_02405 [Thermosporothrix hazakensis]|uniref:Uncharacterized protein n=1 Tax=Thermosporothrix hazakensis TaxID=644383 RepID=A0A326U8B5_THEHA|nr:hypothetical protein EI42_02405 [Thermosporothrix hazakensis]
MRVQLTPARPDGWFGNRLHLFKNNNEISQREPFLMSPMLFILNGGEGDRFIDHTQAEMSFIRTGTRHEPDTVLPACW